MVIVSSLAIKQTGRLKYPRKRNRQEEIGDDLPQVCQSAFDLHVRMLRIRYKTPHQPLGRDLINIGSAKSVPNTDKRHRLLPPLEIDATPGKSLINKLEGIIGELRCELKDLSVKQAEAIEGLRGEMKVLLGQQTEAIQALRDDVKDLLGKQMEVFTMLSVVKDSNTKAGSRSIIIL